jgi:hypothetical protein
MIMRATPKGKNNRVLSNRFPPEVKEWWMINSPYTDM